MEGLGPQVVQDIRIAVFRGTSFVNIARILKSRYPTVMGLSEKSVRRYCRRHNIAKIKDRELDQAVRRAILEVSYFCVIFLELV